MTDDLSVFELAEGGARKDPLAHALAQSAAWQTRAERLEGMVEYAAAYLEASLDTYKHRGGKVPAVEPEGAERLLRMSREALSSPRLEPSRILEVVRAALHWLHEAEQDAAGLGKTMSEYVDLQFSRAEYDLLKAVETLTPEERAALLEEE